jgi:type IV pilus assembly protein PilO
MNIIDIILRQKPLIKILILVVIIGLIIGIYWQGFYKPVQGQINTIEPQLNQLKEELAAKKEIVKGKPRYQAELEETRAKLHLALKQLPDKSEIPSLLENISSLGTAAGLKFILFKPTPEVAKNFYAEIPVDIQVEGKYRDIVTFFDNVSKMPRIVNIMNISISAPKKDPTGAWVVSTSCNAITYKFIESKTAPADESAKKGEKK